VRCREYTKLEDTPANRKRMQKVLDRIEQTIADGSFAYATFFPGSALVERFATEAAQPLQTPVRAPKACHRPPQ